MCDFVSGSVAGIAGLIVGYPFDTVKVNQQTQGIGTLKCTQNIFQTHGIRGFFRGLTFPLVANGLMNSLFFGVYGSTLDAISHLWQSHTLRNLSTKRNLYHIPTEASVSPPSPGYLHMLLAGGVAGLAQLIVSCPVDVIKIKLQTQRSEGSGFGTKSGKRIGPVNLLVHLVSNHGIKGIYQGVLPMAYRDIPASAVYMLLYEVCSRAARVWGQNKHETATVFGIFVAGGIAGTVSWWTILPLDVIKSRIQADDPKSPKYKGFGHCAAHVLRDHGVKGLFRGFWPMSLRAFPVNGVTFIAYEWMQALCRYFNGKLPRS